MMMAGPATRSATYADVEAAPPHLVAELICGTLVTHPRPAPRHAAASAALGMELGGPFQMGRGGPGGWVFLSEPELHLGTDVLVPDIAAWRRERLSELPDAAFLTVAPDWVCEVLSPSTETVDRGLKRQLYASAGVPYLWLVDPRSRLLEASALVDWRWMLLASLRDDEPVRLLPFDAAAFSLGQLWPFDPIPSV